MADELFRWLVQVMGSPFWLLGLVLCGRAPSYWCSSKSLMIWWCDTCWIRFGCPDPTWVRAPRMSPHLKRENTREGVHYCEWKWDPPHSPFSDTCPSSLFVEWMFRSFRIRIPLRRTPRDHSCWRPSIVIRHLSIF